MSLADRSDGILETHVQWDEVEKRMQEAFGTTATFGPNKSVKNIGEGNGFMSRISLINPDWQNKSEGLPDSFVAKICTALTMVDSSAQKKLSFDTDLVIEKILQMCATGHNVEVETYKIMEKYSEGRIPLPRIYASRKFSDENKTKGYLLMEYLPDLTPCHIVDNISIDAMKKVLRSIAIWQGIGMKMTEEEKSIYSTTFLSDDFCDLFAPQMIEQFNDKLQSFCGEEHSKLINEYHDLMIESCSKENYMKLDALPDKLGYKKVFVHGDLWSTNILWTKPNEDYEIRAHIDFQ
ncbi:unnamed protein product, partial [Auanema sp. JU1783]